jgi:hypothetical protein
MISEFQPAVSGPDIATMFVGERRNACFILNANLGRVVVNQILLLINRVAVKDLIQEGVVTDDIVVVFGTGKVKFYFWHDLLEVLKEHAMHEDIPESSIRSLQENFVAIFEEFADAEDFFQFDRAFGSYDRHVI